jgi:hypothetical protein
VRGLRFRSRREPLRWVYPPPYPARPGLVPLAPRSAPWSRSIGARPGPAGSACAGSAAPGGVGRGAEHFRAECRYPWPLVVSTPCTDLRCPRVLVVSVTLPLANTPQYPSIPLNTPDTPHFSFRLTPETFPNLSSICRGISGIQRGMRYLPRGIAGPSIGHPRGITHSDTL